MPEVSLEGTLEENIMVLVHEKTTYLRFQRMTPEELEMVLRFIHSLKDFR